MSSDSGESHSSAHNDNADLDAQGADYIDSSEIDSNLPAGLSEEPDSGFRDENASEASSGTTEGLTFAKPRGNTTQKRNNGIASELSIRNRELRPGSPESNSIPDDTPSIQVGLTMRLLREIY
jgi:vacuolar protein sorting-associated protein 8